MQSWPHKHSEINHGTRQRGIVRTIALLVYALNCATLLIAPTTSHAAGASSGPVDGYRGLKFGSSESTVRAAKPCSFTSSGSTHGLTVIHCPDFVWGGAHVYGSFFFFEDKLEMIQVAVPWDKASITVEALTEKYGAPSRASSPEEFTAALIPGNDARICFAADTVCAKAGTHDGTTLFVLQYIAPNSRSRVRDKTKQSLEPDL